ncbi:PKD domain-containing protein [Filimonas effusa]|uniref:T9SS type B sorting domain-containing protein n=1 Tax=Filimonas effusa TaxID=2508721 RepID=A0A4V1M9Y3_9BACT|nr:PKD domain-containing protein [Filimonas effusa]RXK83274.1 T9SS type B sorting domain-containing protein [Filimonas effusa]
MIKQFIIISVILVAGISRVCGQQLSNSGQDFWVAYGHHQFFEAGNTNGQEMVLYLSTDDKPANVTVSINGTSWKKTYKVPANSALATDYMPKSGVSDARLYTPPVSFGGTGSEGIFNRGIHIESDVPIVAYAHIFGLQSSGATMLLPVETWGFNYTSLNFTQRFNTDCFSWLHVIAAHDNTRIEITTTVPTRGGRTAGEKFNVVLNKGQVYQMLGSGTSVPVGSGYDVSGSTIKVVPNDEGKCFPVAAFSGSSRTQMSMGNCTPLGGDNFIQQLFPAQAWGKRYLTAPFSLSQDATVSMPCYYRVLVEDPATEVRINGALLPGLTPGRYYQFASSSADYITANKPIMVAQYMPSTGCNGSVVGDEEMIYLSPVEQAIKKVVFFRTTNTKIEVNYLTLIIPTQGLLSLRIDGSATYDHSYPHPALPGYSVVVKRWKAAQAQVKVESDSAFTAVTYGQGGTESYGYNAGTLMNNLRGKGEVKNQYSEAPGASSYTCRNTPFFPSVFISIKPTVLRWAFSEGGAMSPATDVVEVSPEPVDSQRVNNLWYYQYTLKQPVAYTDTGNKILPVYYTHPSLESCNHTEVVNIPVVVKPAVKAGFSYSNSPAAQTYTGCRLDTLYFTPLTPASRYRWSFSAAIADTLWQEAPKKLYAAAGNYQVRMQGIMPDGCVADTTIAIQVYPAPVADFSLSASAVCEQSQVSASSAASYGGPASFQSYYWSSGDGRVIDNNNKAPGIRYDHHGIYMVKHVARISETCISDTVTHVVQVYARPVAAFSFPGGCLDASGEVRFTNTSSVADAQPMTYLWNFGDAGSGAANSSTLQHPVHRYTDYKEYTLVLKATTSEGCVHDTTVKASFALRPIMNFDAIPGICGNRTDVLIDKARVTNGVPGSGFYKGPGTGSDGHFNAKQAGAGTQRVWYIYETSGDCKDSISQTIAVLPQPKAGFTVTQEGVCEGVAHTFTDASEESGAVITAHNWLFGDGTVAWETSPVKQYLRPGTYSVRLVVTDASGCISDTTQKTVVLYPKPVVDAGPVRVGKEGTTVTLAGSINDVTAALRWTPATGLSSDAILHPVALVEKDITYTLTATSLYNCQSFDTTSVKVSRLLEIPNVFSPNGDGINDTWMIKNITDYSRVIVQVFNRYGVRVWESAGAGRSWDGNYNQKILPAGTYYYVINLNNGSKPLTGSVTIIR